MTAKRDKPSLRSGYTTGACAAAAAKAATLALLRQKLVEEVEIELPGGEEVSFKIYQCRFDPSQASCQVVKDAGDDPDVTNGAEICATVSWKNEPGIAITGGNGVGVVTKPGLEIAVGMAAINPVPRQMILQSVEKAAGNHLDSKGVEVVISVPRGEQLARRTLNRRIGIVGGISILGTTGIVYPYSVEAHKASISQSLGVAAACGCREMVLTTGRRSERFAQKELSLPEESFIQMADFLGYTLEECAKRGLAKVTIWGMVGKLSKVAAGHLNTHTSLSKVEVDFLAEIASSCSVPQAKLTELRKAVTAHHFLRMLTPEEAGEFCHRLCLLAAQRCREYGAGAFEVECIMTDYNGAILGKGYGGR